ncbi:response regulator [Pseudanabaena yagii]|uniref:Response regulator n=1 Tax=Pseudanabaena yagii GIHE-NHR1 TaxID=2722753 RepID=A0ABX1LUF9_9CYAN|nr:response regulator [Pseudanabaena yagii]NMF59011.1 response regulator [Pseudanabaena yagii GIHE-NHR1]
MEVIAQKTILVIDDDYYICDVLKTCLEIFGGCKAITTLYAEEGLDIVAENPPDAIVLDILMPNMDGFAFLKKLQANPQIADIPVVLLTARADLTDPQAIAKLGVNGAIAKPFHPVKLFSEISQILGW